MLVPYDDLFRYAVVLDFIFRDYIPRTDKAHQVQRISGKWEYSLDGMARPSVAEGVRLIVTSTHKLHHFQYEFMLWERDL